MPSLFNSLFYLYSPPPAPRFNFFDFLLEIPSERQSYKSKAAAEASIAKEPARSSEFLIFELLTELSHLQELIRQREEQRRLMEFVKNVFYFEKNVEVAHKKDVFSSRPCNIILDSGNTFLELPRSRSISYRNPIIEFDASPNSLREPTPRRLASHQEPAPQARAPAASPNHPNRMFASPNTANRRRESDIENIRTDAEGLAAYKYAQADDLANGWPQDNIISLEPIDEDATIVCFPITQTIPDPNNPSGPRIAQTNPDNTPVKKSVIVTKDAWDEIVKKHQEALRSPQVRFAHAAGTKLIEPNTQLEIGKDIPVKDIFVCNMRDFKRHNPNMKVQKPEPEEEKPNNAPGA